MNRGRSIGRLAGTTVGAVALVLTVPGLALATPDDHGTTGKVTLCHATSSVSNPYTMITVDPASIVKGKGHGGHDGPVFVAGETSKGDDWGDIIPPFDHTYRQGGRTHSDHYPGMNWTAEGRAIFDAGCTVPAASPPAEGSGSARTDDAAAAPSQPAPDAPSNEAPAAGVPATGTPQPAGSSGEGEPGGGADADEDQAPQDRRHVEGEVLGTGGGSPLDDAAVRALLAGAGIDTSTEVRGEVATRVADGDVLADGERMRVQPASVEEPLDEDVPAASGVLARTGLDLPLLLGVGLLTLLGGATALLLGRRNEA